MESLCLDLATTTVTIVWPLYRSTCVAGKNWRILLGAKFTVCAPYQISARFCIKNVLQFSVVVLDCLRTQGNKLIEGFAEIEGFKLGMKE